MSRTKAPRAKVTKSAPLMAGATDPASGRHSRGEDHPWTVWVDDHPERKGSADYIASRKKMNGLARTVGHLYYGPVPYEDHHGGALWLKDEDGWFVVRNLAGMEWSSQFCADPAKVDALRVNAKRLYERFPEAVDELGIRELLDTPIETSEDVARWTDSICNASLPLPKAFHVGVVSQAATTANPDEEPQGGYHHYPAPIVEQQLFKYDDFQLWVTEDEQPVAVVPVGERGSGDGRTAVVYASPGTDLAKKKEAAARRNKPLILDEDDQLSLRAFNDQYTKIFSDSVPKTDPLTRSVERRAAPQPRSRRVAAKKYGL